MKMKRGWRVAILAILLIVGLTGLSYADVTLSGSLRVRGITVDNGDCTATQQAQGKCTPGKVGTSGGFWEQRTRLNANATINDNTRVFIQVQDSRMWGSEASTASTGTGDINLALSQGYFEMKNLFDQPLTLRVGRQGIAYGEHRLIGTFEWSNNARRFDAIKLTYDHDLAKIDLWTGKLMDTGDDFGNDVNLNVLYVMLKNIPNNNVDLYVIQKISGATDMNFYTYGARVKGGVEDFNVDYTAEVAIQSGDYDKDSSQDATAFAIRAGYTFPDILGGLRIGVEYDSATGNDSPNKPGYKNPNTTNADNKAFDNLYPTNHYLYGFTDDVGWSNMQAWSVNVRFQPIDNLRIALEYWKYNKDKDQYDSTGKNLGDDNGNEFNVRLNHKLNKYVNCEAAYVVRNAGDFATKAYASGKYGTIPKNQSATFAYFMINVNFM